LAHGKITIVWIPQCFFTINQWLWIPQCFFHLFFGCPSNESRDSRRPSETPPVSLAADPHSSAARSLPARLPGLTCAARRDAQDVTKTWGIWSNQWHGWNLLESSSTWHLSIEPQRWNPIMFWRSRSILLRDFHPVVKFPTLRRILGMGQNWISENEYALTLTIQNHQH
jgi:hypothetical protein